MQALIFLGIIWSLIAMEAGWHNEGTRHDIFQANTAAWAMNYYANQASALCAPASDAITCTEGTVPLTSMAGAGAGALYGPNGSFISVTNGTNLLLTTWQAPAGTLVNNPASIYGHILSALQSQSFGGYSVNVGVWVKSSQTVRYIGSYSSTTTEVAVPQGFGGLVLHDQQPVILQVIQ